MMNKKGMDTNSYKVVLIGDTGVGKSSIAYWLLRNKRTIDLSPTIGAAFMTKEIKIPAMNSDGTVSETAIKLNIWDTAGQERFRSIARMYYRNSAGCVCVFDVTNRTSFTNLQYWIKDYRENNLGSDGVVIIIANKCDLPIENWAVRPNEIDDFAYNMGCDYFKTNCIDGENIQTAFKNLSIGMHQKIYPQTLEYPKNDIMEDEDKKDTGIIVDLTRRTKDIYNEKCCGS